ncbi:stage II sporulation protein P [Faecalimonas umbilicata]|uniref:stage II sporulation protein P n=1 Tax=Faecalimonas umbilicata TaxID=1912855 RepID=UPI000E3FF979|nr:stage II sporulation protein P [Faecalimonas umbilicata]RGC79179.1 stage II sporulation protein P [Lachnospiraceae bacterium AM25-17]RJU67991.1 stage II sporulation protein P [Coprococcus sp. AM27-12LB]
MTGKIAIFLVFLCILQNMGTVFDKKAVAKSVQKRAEERYLPSLSYLKAEPVLAPGEWIVKQAMQILPAGGYLRRQKVYRASLEDEETYEMILKKQAEDENEVGADGKLVNPEKAVTVEEPPKMAQVPPEMSIEKLRDFDYLLSNFYTVDSATMIGPDQLNADDLLSRSMKIEKQGDAPKILIFHTHSQEAFIDSVEGDTDTTIVGMGKLLAERLNALGIPTIHHPGVYDLINGQLDRSAAYEYAEAGVRPILEEHPSIEVVIDLHRDGVGEDTHLVTEVNGKPTAQIMFFNGLSRTKDNGDIAYLPNPYIQDNLAFSLQMKLAAEQMYPGFTRRIFLRGYRYSLHMRPKSLLIEAGAQTNTVEEMRNAMELLAVTLQKVIVENP